MSELLQSLQRIEGRLEDLSIRIGRLEEKADVTKAKTDDIHQFVPFVGWLSYVAASLPKRLLPGRVWQAEIEDQEAS